MKTNYGIIFNIASVIALILSLMSYSAVCSGSHNDPRPAKLAEIILSLNTRLTAQENWSKTMVTWGTNLVGELKKNQTPETKILLMPQPQLNSFDYSSSQNDIESKISDLESKIKRLKSKVEDLEQKALEHNW